MEDKKKSKKHIWDKIIMGAVVGGAIGSVIGASIAPKKGKETRQEIIETAKESKSKIKKLFRFFRKSITEKANHDK